MNPATPEVEGCGFAQGDRVEFKGDGNKPVPGVVFGVCDRYEDSVCIHYIDREWGDQYAYRRPGLVLLVEAAPAAPGHHAEEEDR